MSGSLPVPSTRYSGGAVLTRLLRFYLRPHAKKILLAVGCMVVGAAATAMQAWLMQPVLDKIFLEKDATALIFVPLAVAGATILNGFAAYGQTVTMRNTGQAIVSRMQTELFSHLVHADLALFHDTSSGKLISRFTNDIILMRTATTSVLTALARDSFSMLFLIGLMFYQSWQLGIIACFLFPLAVAPVIRLGRRMRKVSEHTQAQLADFTSQLDETFQGVKIVKAYAREEYEVGRARQIIDHLTELYAKSSRIQAAASPIMESLAGVLTAVVIWYGGWQVLEGTTTPGAFFSFVTAMVMAYRPAKSLAGLNTMLQEGLAAARRLFVVLDTPPAIADAPNAPALACPEGTLTFEQVTFTYPSWKSAPEGETPRARTLEDVSLTIPAGRTVALVGPSGGGKSTLVQLALRFYDVDSGRIRVDGQDIREVAQKSLRQHIAFVSQEIVLFDDTVRANILYGRLAATDDEMMAAAKAAAAHDFITTLPDGYETRIGQHGVKLSGGQRQRLSIARAILKDAPILLLDEATSALDPVSEKRIQEALITLMRGRTTLVIAHRLSTVMNADLICVIDGGRIVESGSHAGLLAQKGLYSHLYQKYLETDEVA
ncbi:MAG: ABC transporter ATP-binding protein [Alphaproteobacteria bacterium]|nr:ABC transporter ATP-binding protein [Alphaproteobacteria bacterium]